MREPSRAWFIVPVTVVVFGSGVGCAQTKIVMHGSEALRVEQEGRLHEIAFLTTFEARTLANEQLVYQVRLFGRGYEPIRSADGKYELSNGQVGAARAVMVLRSPQLFQDVRVAIPARELHLQPEHLPALAEVGVFRASGECLARLGARIPIGDESDLLPPLQRPEVDEPCYWFVRGVGRWSPLLYGPFDSEAEARENLNSPEDVPREIGGAAYVWVVPLWEKIDTEAVEWVGPCASEDDVGQLVEVLDDVVEESGGTHVMGPPMMIRMSTWIDRQKSAGAAPEP